MGTATIRQDRIGVHVPHDVYETLCRAAGLTGPTVNQFLAQPELVSKLGGELFHLRELQGEGAFHKSAAAIGRKMLAAGCANIIHRGQMKCISI